MRFILNSTIPTGRVSPRSRYRLRYRLLGVVTTGVLLLWLRLQLVSPLPETSAVTARRALGAATLNEQLYAIGGWNGVATQLDLVEVYDPTTRQWHTGPPLIVARSQHGVVAAGRALWVIGGWHAEHGLVSAVERLAPADTHWQIVTHLPNPRREPGIALWQEQIVVAGGFNGQSDADLEGYSDRVDAYDWRHDRWQRLAKLSVPRRGLVLVTVADRLFAIGGYSAEEGFTNLVEEYDPNAQRWINRAWPLTPRTWVAATGLADASALVIAGGYNLDGVLALVERVDIATGEVCHPLPLTAGRAWFAVIPTPSGVVALGGETAAGFTGTSEWVATDCE